MRWDVLKDHKKWLSWLRKVYLTYPNFWLQAAVYKICKEMYCEGMEDIPVVEEPDLIGDR